MDDITNYDKWKFRRCIETIDRYGCIGLSKNRYPKKCENCQFNIIYDKWHKLLLDN